MDTRLQVIISEFRSIIAKDGEVDEEDLRSWISLDDEIDDKYKTEEGIKPLIAEITKPEKLNDREEISVQRMKLYELGWTDKMIGDFQGTTPMAIYMWRRVRKLKSNSVEGGQNEAVNRTTKRNG